MNYKIKTILITLTVTLLVFTGCEQAKTKAIAALINKGLPATSNGVTVLKATAEPDNTVRINAHIDTELGQYVSEGFFDKLRPALKSAFVNSLDDQSKEMIIDANITLIYDFKKADGAPLGEIAILPDDLKNTKTVVNQQDAVAGALTPQTMVDAVKPNLPMVVSEKTEMTLVDIYIKDNVLHYVYEVPKANMISEDPGKVKAAIIETLGNNPTLKDFIVKGINVRFVYNEKTDKTPIVSIDITKEDFK